MRLYPYLTALIALLLTAPFAAADGFIIVRQPHPIPGHFPFAPLEVAYHRVSVDITDTVATTTVDEEFRNPTSDRTEGTYLFPLPKGAHIDKFTMDINGKPAEAELLPADKARSIYEDIVRKMRDPALLEYTGRDAFKVRIFPIEPYGTKRITIKYTQLLKEDAGLIEYAYPLNTEKFSSKPIPQVSITARITSSDPIKSIYSPSHSVDVKRTDPTHATASWEATDARPDTDFKLIYTCQHKGDVSLRLLTYKSPTDDAGYFMLLASPGEFSGGPQGRAAPKDVLFLVDTSGSMAGKKLDQAKSALNFCLANLNPDDRFNLVRFSTETDTLFNELESADKRHLKKAGEFVDALRARGGTNIDDALTQALKLRRTDAGSRVRPYLVIFLTDGAPTVGNTDEDTLVAHALKQSDNTRIFCFGIGNDVNTHLLDRLADQTRAASQYVLPNEDIEVKVSNFYDKVRDPVMTDLALTFSGSVHTSQLYPAKLPDLFKGDTLLLLGRYTGSGPGAAVLTGSVTGDRKTFSDDLTFTDDDTTHDFIPKLWATRRVGYLLDEIRLHGESAEVKDEVVRLAREHGIVTPYTAYLIVEDEAKRNVPVAQRSFQELEQDKATLGTAKDYYDSTVTESRNQAFRSGSQAVANAQAYGQLRGAANTPAASAAPEALAKRPTNNLFGQGNAGAAGGNAYGGQGQSGYRAAQSQNYAQQSRLIRNRAFYQNGAIWIDATAQTRQNLKHHQIRFNSDDYFALLRAHPESAEYLALGNNLDLVLDDTLYSIRDN